jgi:hypothetical protein
MIVERCVGNSNGRTPFVQRAPVTEALCDVKYHNKLKSSELH